MVRLPLVPVATTITVMAASVSALPLNRAARGDGGAGESTLLFSASFVDQIEPLAGGLWRRGRSASETALDLLLEVAGTVQATGPGRRNPAHLRRDSLAGARLPRRGGLRALHILPARQYLARF